jgi:transposase-like protein
MRLQLVIPVVEPDKIAMPRRCPYPGCSGGYFQHHQEIQKELKDTVHRQVAVHRYRCLSCRRTFRVYPVGVTQAQTSQRVKGLAVLLYLLGLSYGAVSLTLEALGCYMCKSRVYDAVQAAAERVPGLRREEVFQGIRTPALGGDVTSVRCNGRWLPLGLTVDSITGTVLTIDALSGEDTQALKAWLEPIATAVGAQLLVSDDADSFKGVSDEVGLEQQVCKSHVRRSTAELIQSIQPDAVQDRDGSLEAIGITSEQAVADLLRLGELVLSRQPQEERELAQMHHRYLAASPPRPGEKASTAYRLRMLFLDRWNLWGRLTRYRTWHGPGGETVDGTNNACERAIGWWVKERYRTMRGYKREKSAVNVSRLLAWCGNHLERGGARLAPLIA